METIWSHFLQEYGRGGSGCLIAAEGSPCGGKWSPTRGCGGVHSVTGECVWVPVPGGLGTRNGSDRHSGAACLLSPSANTAPAGGPRRLVVAALSLPSHGPDLHSTQAPLGRAETIFVINTWHEHHSSANHVLVPVRL